MGAKMGAEPPELTTGAPYAPRPTLLPRPHAAWGHADAMIAAQIAPSRADLRIRSGRFRAAVAISSQRWLQSRALRRHVTPTKASRAVGRSTAAARVVIAIDAILHSSYRRHRPAAAACRTTSRPLLEPTLGVGVAIRCIVQRPPPYRPRRRRRAAFALSSSTRRVYAIHVDAAVHIAPSHALFC